MRQEIARFGEKQIKIWNMWENFKITYKNLNGKLIFYPSYLPPSRSFVIFYTTGADQIFWGVVLIQAWGVRGPE